MFATMLRGSVILATLQLLAPPAAAQVPNAARTFRNGPISVTVFDGTGLAEGQVVLDLIQGDRVEVLSIPIDVKVPKNQQNVLIVQFIGHFMLDPAPVTITVDCLIDHQLDLSHGCGITPSADFSLPNIPPAGANTALVPATFLIRDLPPGIHQIGIGVEIASPMELPRFGKTKFFVATSSLIASLYAERGQ